MSRVLLVLLLVAAARMLPAQSRPEPVVIRSWGDEAMAGVLARWQQAFHARHPEVAFSQQLNGSGTGMAGIITGTSELALMGRPVTVNEVIGFEWVFRYKPLQIQILNGALTPGTGQSPSLVVVVSQQNPLTTISMQQLATLLACPAECSEPPTWAAAGATGAWASHPVHAYLPDNQTGTGAFLQAAVLGTADRWNWAVVHEFRDDPAGLLQALARDRHGLAIASVPPAGKGFKTLRVDGIAPTAGAVTAATYPLSRGVYIDINRRPGTPVSPPVAAFLDFILGPEGQAIAAQEGTFLPLNQQQAAEQARKLQ